jgi:hypothetical protein
MSTAKEIPEPIITAVNALLAPYGTSYVDGEKYENIKRRYLSTDAAIEYTALSRSTINRAVVKGDLKQIKMHPGRKGRVLFDIKDLDLFIAAHR